MLPSAGMTCHAMNSPARITIPARISFLHPLRAGVVVVMGIMVRSWSRDGAGTGGFSSWTVPICRLS